MMRRVLGSAPVALLTVLAAVVAAAALLWPVVDHVVPQSGSGVPDPVTITDYRADLRVDDDGTLLAVETITAHFPCCRHGIFRFWDVAPPWDSRARLIPEAIDVTLDGRPEQVELLWERGRKYRVAKIGDPDTTLTSGQHVYQIKYTIKGALAAPSAGATTESGSWSAGGDGSVFYWDVVAGGWQMEIGRSETRVTLPTPADEIKCTYGFDSSGDCLVRGGGTESIVITTGPLGPRTPVTVRATQSIPTPDRVTVPWSPSYDGVLGTSLPLAVAVGILALLGLVAGRAWEWTTREEPPGYPVMYQPPPGLGPVQTYFVMNERVPPDGLVATLLYQAERGLTKLSEVADKKWLVQATGADWGTVDGVTRKVGETLGVTQSGGAFIADGGVDAGSSLNRAKEGLTKEVRQWASSSGLLRGRGTETLGRIAVVAAALLAAVLIWFRPGGMSLWAMPFAAFTVGGIGMLRPGVGTRRTSAGRDHWSRAGGFHRLLSTTSAEDRFDFSAHRELYTAYIPYAVAFGVADKWAEKYQLSTGEIPPQPTWYVGSTSNGFSGAHSSFAGFESSLRSSIGAYESSQSSSSSSGGGFSGGGGGGGGGGGSW